MLSQGELAGLVGLGWPGWADLAGGSCLDWLGWLARWLADWASLVAGLAEPAQLAALAGWGWAGCMCFICTCMCACKGVYIIYPQHATRMETGLCI